MNLIWLSLLGIFFIAIFLLSVEVWILLRREIRKRNYHQLIMRKMQILDQLQKEFKQEEVPLNNVFKENFGRRY